MLVLLALGACSGGDASPQTSATVPSGPTTTADPYAVPEVITIKYLNRVFEALERTDGEATRLIIASQRIPPEAADRLAAITTPEEFKVQTDIWLNDLAAGVSDFKPVPGDRVTKVVEILRMKPECVLVTISRDYSPRLAGPKPPLMMKTALTRKPPGAFNPTPWVIAREGSLSDRACAA